MPLSSFSSYPRIFNLSTFLGISKSKKDAPKSFKKQKTGKRKVSVSSDDTGNSSISEDEWEDVDFVGQSNFDTDTVEVTIKSVKPVETEESKWAKFIRQQVNRKIRERQINCHKVSLISNFFIARIKPELSFK